MLEARKENKVYSITEQQKDRYLKEGFDIYENGVIIEHTPKKLIKYSDHLSILEREKELLLKNQLQTPNNVLDLLKSYAESKSIDIGSSTSPKGILDKILEVEKE